MNRPDLDQTISLQVRRLFSAPRERVFRAWVERDALQKWFRPFGLAVVVTYLDAQIGGGFRFETPAPDGSLAITSGNYIEISFPEKLVFTWISAANGNQDTLVTVEFIDQGAATEVILTHNGFPAGTDLTPFQHGWQSIFDHLAGAL